MSNLNRVAFGVVTLDIMKEINDDETLESLNCQFDDYCVNGIELEITDIENKTHRFSNIRADGGIPDWHIKWKEIMVED